MLWEDQNRFASAQAVVEVEERGVASAQQVVQSVMVRICVCPWERGTGQTRSTWMWEKIGMGVGEDEMCVHVLEV